MQNATVQSQPTSDIRVAAITPFSASSTMLHTAADTTAAAAAMTSAVTSEAGADTTDWSTPLVNVTSSGNEWVWSSPAAAERIVEFNVTTATTIFSTAVTSSDLSLADSGDEVDVAYERLTNLAVIVAVYSLVVVSVVVIVCRRRCAGYDYVWIDREVCCGASVCHDDDDDDAYDFAAFKRYWDTRRDLDERQRLLDSLRVDNISAVAAGHLIDRLPEDVV